MCGFPAAKTADHLLAHPHQVDQRQFRAEQERVIGRLGVLAQGDGLEHEVILAIHLLFQRPHRAQVDQGDAAIAQQQDVAGMEVGVEVIVLGQLAIERLEEAMAGFPGIDVVFHQPVLQPIGVLPLHRHVIGHDDAVEVLHDEHAARAVAGVRPRRMNLVIGTQELAHVAQVGLLVAIIRLLLEDLVQLPDQLVPAEVVENIQLLQDPDEAAEQAHVLREDLLNGRSLHLDRDPALLVEQASLVDLGNRRGGEGRFLEFVEETVQGAPSSSSMMALTSSQEKPTAWKCSLDNS